MSSDVAIRISGLSKAYRIRHEEQQITLAEQALHRLRRPLKRPAVETFWALKDIDLEIQRGEVLGLIGCNGAGKSTLLKILSRITPPTTGRIDIFGRIGSLLEVGTGFHPELTGRENVYLNGAILGMRKPEIDRQFDAIVDFAGVDRFLDTPVKRYSSGMAVRLAFAVAAHLDTEILFVDEVLAVGDAEFQEKCLGKMGGVAASGRTVVLVSHNLVAMQAIASAAVLIEAGQVAARGETERVVAAYSQRPLRSTSASHGCSDDRPIVIQSVELVEGVWGPLDRTVTVHISAEARQPSPAGVGIGVILRSALGQAVASGYLRVPPSGTSQLSCYVKLDLVGLPPGEYRGTVNLSALERANDWRLDDTQEDAFALSVHATAHDGLLARHWDSATHGHHRLGISLAGN